MKGDIIRAILRLNHSIKRELVAMNQVNECSSSQIRLLHQIYRSNAINEELYQKDLEDFFNLQKSTVSELLASLEKKDLIKRVPSKKDARFKKIELTPLGIEFSNLTYNNLALLEEKTCLGFNENELNNLIETILKMTERLEGKK